MRGIIERDRPGGIRLPRTGRLADVRPHLGGDANPPKIRVERADSRIVPVAGTFSPPRLLSDRPMLFAKPPLPEMDRLTDVRDTLALLGIPHDAADQIAKRHLGLESPTLPKASDQSRLYRFFSSLIKAFEISTDHTVNSIGVLLSSLGGAAFTMFYGTNFLVPSGSDGTTSRERSAFEDRIFKFLRFLEDSDFEKAGTSRDNLQNMILNEESGTLSEIVFRAFERIERAMSERAAVVLAIGRTPPTIRAMGLHLFSAANTLLIDISNDPILRGYMQKRPGFEEIRGRTSAIINRFIKEYYEVVRADTTIDEMTHTHLLRLLTEGRIPEFISRLPETTRNVLALTVETRQAAILASESPQKAPEEPDFLGIERANFRLFEMLSTLPAIRGRWPRLSEDELMLFRAKVGSISTIWTAVLFSLLDEARPTDMFDVAIALKLWPKEFGPADIEGMLKLVGHDYRRLDVYNPEGVNLNEALLDKLALQIHAEYRMAKFGGTFGQPGISVQDIKSALKTNGSNLLITVLLDLFAIRHNGQRMPLRFLSKRTVEKWMNDKDHSYHVISFVEYMIKSGRII